MPQRHDTSPNLGVIASRLDTMPGRGDNLHLAATRGKPYRVAACLANGEDPNGLDGEQRTPLAISCSLGHLAVRLRR